MALQFFKMTGGGNDFVVFDNRDGCITMSYDQLARQVCNRNFGVGGDGLLVLEKHDQLDFTMVYYNSDGSLASMCGNGARCMARFAYTIGAAKEKMDFMTGAGQLSAEIFPDSVKLKMSQPQDLKLDITLPLAQGHSLTAGSLNTGVPHAVVFAEDVEQVNVQSLGGLVRYHSQFAPNGTNANFVQVLDDHNLIVRTYERGVEGETLACGTGIVASSLIAALKGRVSSPVSCLARGGDKMKVYFNLQDSQISQVYLEGPAVIVFKGEIA